MQWRHLQPGRRKRVLEAAAINILVSPTPKRLPWRIHTREEEDQQEEIPARPHLQVDLIQTLASLLRKCNTADSLQHGKRIHSQIVSAGHTRNTFLGMLLMRMYGNCGCPTLAKSVFHEFNLEHNVVAWSNLVDAFGHNGEHSEVLKLYKELSSKGVEPNSQIFIRALVACSALRCLSDGKSIHSKVVSTGYDSQVGVCTTLIDMYGKCGCSDEAYRVFQRMESRTVATWNAMVSCYAQTGHIQKAMILYREMNSEGINADVFTFSIVLGICGLQEGQIVHDRVKADGLEGHVVVGTALVRMYSRWGKLEQAVYSYEKVINKDVVCLTAIIAAFVEAGHNDRAVGMYREALEKYALEPDAYTFSTVLCACTGPKDLLTGRGIHELIVSKKLDTDVIVGTALVNMYGRCRDIISAKNTFDRIHKKNVVSWNAMLAAYAEAGLHEEVVKLYTEMDTEPDVLVFSKVLASCANIGDVSIGVQVHRRIKSIGIQSDGTIENGLVSMYSRCGSFHVAKNIFHTSPKRDPVCWNTMISASSRFACVEVTKELLQEMLQEGIEPNEITFMSVLHACAHAGLVDEGFEIFRWMSSERCVVIQEHFHCLIDLLGRLGLVSEAEELLYRMPFEPDVVAWTTLVGACKVHQEAECAARCAEHVSSLETTISGPYILLSNICSGPEELEYEF